LTVADVPQTMLMCSPYQFAYLYHKADYFQSELYTLLHSVTGHQHIVIVIF